MFYPVSSKRGFTLVELAIVMVIIGLIIGAILQGKRIIENARLTAQIAQIDAVRAALAGFKDKYDQKPGDMSNATLRIPGCTAANFCQNGNGDGDLGIDGLPNNLWYLEDQSALASERTQFWRHLLLADMIAGVDTGNTVGWGQSHPQSTVGMGGIQIAHGASPVNSGNYFLRLQRSPQGQPNGGVGTHALSPISARIIDEKIDDKMPSAGYVQALNPALPNVCEDAAGTAYIGSDVHNCLVFFILEK